VQCRIVEQCVGLGGYGVVQSRAASQLEMFLSVLQGGVSAEQRAVHGSRVWGNAGIVVKVYSSAGGLKKTVAPFVQSTVQSGAVHLSRSEKYSLASLASEVPRPVRMGVDADVSLGRACDWMGVGVCVCVGGGGVSAGRSGV
jgi:hypothetical protein